MVRLGIVRADDDGDLRVLVQGRQPVGRVPALHGAEGGLAPPLAVDHAEGPVPHVVSAGEPLVGEREHARPRRAHLERGPDLPRQDRRLLLSALAHRVDAELREDDRAAPRERVQPIEVAAEIRLAVQVDVEGEKVGELGLEILRGRKIGVAHERARVDLLDHAHELAQKAGDPRGAVPADDVGRNLVADHVGRHRGMARARLHRVRHRSSDVRRHLLRVEEAHVLGPGDSHQQAHAAAGGEVEHVAGRDGEGPEGIGPELGDQVEVPSDGVPVGKLRAQRVRRERPVGDALEEYLVGAGEEELAARLELAGPVRQCVGVRRHRDRSSILQGKSSLG